MTSSALANDQRRRPPRKPWRDGTSNHDMWLAHTSTGSSMGGRFSSPVTCPVRATSRRHSHASQRSPGSAGLGHVGTFGAEKPILSTRLHHLRTPPMSVRKRGPGCFLTRKAKWQDWSTGRQRGLGLGGPVHDPAAVLRRRPFHEAKEHFREDHPEFEVDPAG